jgi:hypothetical protein
VSNQLKKNLSVIFYLTAFSTLAGGILHLLMIGPELKPVNFPMEMLPYTDGLFIMSGILQIFWCIPMIMRWGYKWYLAGLIGTIGLSILLLITRIPNGITGLPLEDRNPMALLTEISQFLFIGSTLIVIKYSKFSNNSYKLGINMTENTHQIHQFYDLYKETNGHFKESFSPTLYSYEDTMYILKKIEYKININSRDSRLWIARGITLRKLGSNDEAIKSFDEAIKLDPTESTAWYQKGLCLNILGKRNDSMKMYRLANWLNFISQDQN